MDVCALSIRSRSMRLRRYLKCSILMVHRSPIVSIGKWPGEQRNAYRMVGPQNFIGRLCRPETEALDRKELKGEVRSLYCRRP